MTIITPAELNDIEDQLEAAARTLKPVNKSDANSSFDSAVAFHLTALRSVESVVKPDGTLQSLVVPAVVNYALAVELYLKSLLLCRAKKARGHELKKCSKIWTALTQRIFRLNTWNLRVEMRIPSTLPL
jgi:hypothetical protein